MEGGAAPLCSESRICVPFSALPKPRGERSPHAGAGGRGVGRSAPFPMVKVARAQGGRAFYREFPGGASLRHGLAHHSRPRLVLLPQASGVKRVALPLAARTVPRPTDRKGGPCSSEEVRRWHIGEAVGSRPGIEASGLRPGRDATRPGTCTGSGTRAAAGPGSGPPSGVPLGPGHTEEQSEDRSAAQLMQRRSCAAVRWQGAFGPAVPGEGYKPGGRVEWAGQLMHRGARSGKARSPGHWGQEHGCLEGGVTMRK
ncbi:hypothetical protein NDU88_003259 [Pleurodeles waltl]|uniref:Uncharacterized protein n=1 Tax=Pleurodeles waltl TaxID=8319 RepID=A0AAV7UC95_PLEWA|nr:hypothetical protein NDU88_003259 [Pleurodeles waltl]